MNLARADPTANKVYQLKTLWQPIGLLASLKYNFEVDLISYLKESTRYQYNI